MTKKKERQRPDPRINYDEQKKNLVNLRDRTPEERSRIARMGVEARRRKKKEKEAEKKDEKMLQKSLRALLNMQCRKPEQKEIIRSFGFSAEETVNKTLLMITLFQKGLTGDVAAIREIVNMMDKLEISEKTGELSGSVTINLLPVGQSYVPNEEDEREIDEAQNFDPLNDEPEMPDEDGWDIDGYDDDEDWGEEVYRP